MARSLERLTARTIAAAPAGALLQDGGGLSLAIGDQPERGKWTFRYTSPVTGKRREAGVGAFPAYGLAKARARAEAMRELIRTGVDPLHAAEVEAKRQRAEIAERERQTARDSATVAKVADEVHRRLAPTFRNRKHAAQWFASLELHVFPTLGARPVATVTPKELLDLLLPLRDKVPETARRLRQRLETIFEHAALHGMCEANPASVLKRALRQKSTKQHFAALDFRELAAFVVRLRDNPAGFVSARLALEFAILAAARTGEVLGATWGEINEAERVWCVPGARMKRGIEHRVPLTARMIEILGEARSLVHVERGDDAAKIASRPIFPSPMNVTKPLSNMAMLTLLRRMKTGATLPDNTVPTFADVTTVHGLCRSTFSTWAREKTSFKDSVIEAALAHAEKNAVAAAYSRADYWDQRVTLAAQWERFVTMQAAPVVVPIRGHG